MLRGQYFPLTTRYDFPFELSQESKNKLLAELVFAYGYAEYTIKFLDNDEPLNDIQDPKPNVIYITKTTHDDVQLFSVKKEYTEDFTSIYVTADDLKLTRLPQNQDECNATDISTHILSLTASKKLTNTGFHGKAPGKIVDASDLDWYIRAIATLVTLSLLTELSFAALQFYFGLDALVGLLKYIMPVAISLYASYLLSGIGSLLDLRLNLSLVSPTNNALQAGILSVDTDSKWVEYMMTLNLVFSLLIAYPAGGTGNVAGVLKLLMPDSKCPGVDTCMSTRNGTIPLTIFTIVVAVAYYFVFANSNRKKTFEDFLQFLSAAKTDNNFWRNCQIIIESISNIAFRATLLSATTIATFGYYFPMPEQSQKITAIIVTLGVTQDLLSSRIIKTVEHWSKPDRAYVKENEVADVLKNLSWKDTFSLSETGIALIMTLGAILMTITPGYLACKIVGAILTAVILPVNLMAQRNGVASDRVIKGLEGELPERKLQAQREYDKLPKFFDNKHGRSEKSPTTTPLLSDFSGDATESVIIQPTKKQKSKNEIKNAERNERVEVAQQMYNALGNAIGVQNLTTLDNVSIAGSLFIRGAAELTSTDVFTVIWALGLKPLELLGLVLLLTPPTLRNFGQMCVGSLSEIRAQKAAETYLLYRREDPNNTTTFDEWQKANRMTIFARTFINHMGNYTVDELREPIIVHAEKLGHNFNRV